MQNKGGVGNPTVITNSANGANNAIAVQNRGGVGNPTTIRDTANGAFNTIDVRHTRHFENRHRFEFGADTSNGNPCNKGDRMSGIWRMLAVSLVAGGAMIAPALASDTVISGRATASAIASRSAAPPARR